MKKQVNLNLLQTPKDYYLSGTSGYWFEQERSQNAVIIRPLLTEGAKILAIYNTQYCILRIAVRLKDLKNETTLFIKYMR